jgi:AcrR family transcriptional regulator
MDTREARVRRGGRPKVMADAARRIEILDAAYSAFLELGFARTSTAEIAKRAKTSKRAIYEIFTNKMDLFAWVIRERRQLILDLPRPAEETLPTLTTLIKIFRLDADEEVHREREAVLNLLSRESVLFPELSDYLYENAVIRSREALVDWLEGEMAKGRIPKGDGLVYAGMLMDVVFGALLPRRRMKGARDRAINTAHIKQRLHIFLRGI